MGWSFRKSFGRGPLRLNLSKSGLGISSGIKGMRLSVGPRGPLFSASRWGVSYGRGLGRRRSGVWVVVVLLVAAGVYFWNARGAAPTELDGRAPRQAP